MPASPRHWGQPNRGFRQRLFVAVCAGLLAPITVACGSSGSSSDYSSPLIHTRPPEIPEASESPPFQEPESPPAQSFHRGGGDDSLYLNKDQFYDSGTGCSVVDGVVSC